MQKDAILIVGTTSDYIDIIQRRLPGRTLFLTDTMERQKAKEDTPPEGTELLCHLASSDETLKSLKHHLDLHNTALSGIACFDCESMHLAALLADALSLAYHSPNTINQCRNKHTGKAAWAHAGVPCPRTSYAETLPAAVALIPKLIFPVVIKPVSGSGSELVFKCNNAAEFRQTLNIMETVRTDNQNSADKPLYSRDPFTIKESRSFVIEEFIAGPEYSCDFFMDEDRLEILRVARKIPENKLSFASTLAYIVPTPLPPLLDADLFRKQMYAAATALGLKRAVCMADFIIRNNKAVMLELSPRPGGDCLPQLIKQSSGFDILCSTIEFAGGRFPDIPPASQWQQLVGLRLLADSPGTIIEINTSGLQKDSRVIEYHIKHGPGHQIISPPADYDSRIIGHAIFKPSNTKTIINECRQIAGLIKTEVSK